MRYAELEESLCRLTTVDAVRVVGDQSAISEIHVLATPGKPAKQVVRDVQSLAMASFGITIDRRVISVVQIESDEQGRGDRPAIVDITQQPEGPKTTVEVTLAWKNEIYIGTSTGPTGPTSLIRIVGEATLAAVEQALGEDFALALAALEMPVIGARPIAIAQVVMVSGGEERLLVGCAVVGPDEAQAAVRGTLDAINRVVPQLKR